MVPADFAPDACLVNRYAPGSRLSLHQDRNERDYGAPIVSVSLGMPAMTMVFRAAEPGLLDQVKVGDKIRFAVERVGGALTVTSLEAAQ